ncbi:hypothetical protein D3C72_2291000 [compost metagenome]
MLLLPLLILLFLLQRLLLLLLQLLILLFLLQHLLLLLLLQLISLDEHFLLLVFF